MNDPYNTILLDADETLFDFRRSEQYALNATFAEYGLGPIDAVIDRFRDINAVVWKEYESGESTPEEIRTKRFVLLLRELGLSAEPHLLSDAYIEHLAATDFLIDGAIRLLETLSASATLVMLTNGLSKVQRSRFSRTPVLKYFADVVISEEVGVQKPDPEVFRIALNRSPAGPPALMIGDNLHSDIGGALAMGLDACWVNLRGRTNDTGLVPTYEVARLAEIPRTIGLSESNSD